MPKRSAADDEYTPARRTSIDARLNLAAKGVQHGPFDTAAAAVEFLEKEIGQRTGRRKAL